jgi:hypothetical protein
MPKGSLTIAQGIRARCSVDAELAAQYEVSPAEARSHLADNAQRAFAKVRQAFGDARKRKAEARGATPDESWTNPLPASASELFGVDPADMMSDSETAKKGATNLLNFIVQAARDASGDEAVKQTVADGLERLDAELENPDGQLAKALDAANTQMQSALPALGERMDALGDALKRAATAIRDPEGEA